jgi:rubrerythrin
MMRSVIRSAISDFERENAHLAEPVGALFDRFCAEPAAHARFMNTLSLMEHIGSRKIMATQHGDDLDQPTLKHLAEETRHAFFFKRQAERVAKRRLSYGGEELVAPAAARMYFQRLEAAIDRALRDGADRRAVYLYTSMIVEFRAVWAYRMYQDALARAGLSVSLKSLLAEEEGHLAEMAGRLDDLGAFSPEQVRAFCAEERRLFERLIAALADSQAEPVAA